MPSPESSSDRSLSTAQLYASKTPGEAELEKQLALVTDAIAGCFTQMATEDLTPFRDQRRQEAGIATDLLRLSRELVVSLSKVRKRYQEAANLSQELLQEAAAAEKIA
jgi:hypothetical protein